MKIFEVTEKLQESERGDGAKTAQAMKRAGMDVDNTTFNKTANQNFSGTDAVDQISFKGRKADDRRRKDIDDRFKDQEKKDKEEKDKEDRQNAIAQARADKASERKKRKAKAKDDAENKRGNFNRQVKQTSADSRGLRRGADGRILQHAKWYNKNDSRGKPRGAIGKGLDRLRTDPAYAVSSYYNDKVDQVKDFLNQRI